MGLCRRTGSQLRGRTAAQPGRWAPQWSRSQSPRWPPAASASEQDPGLLAWLGALSHAPCVRACRCSTNAGSIIRVGPTGLAWWPHCRAHLNVVAVVVVRSHAPLPEQHTCKQQLSGKPPWSLHGNSLKSLVQAWATEETGSISDAQAGRTGLHERHSPRSDPLDARLLLSAL